MISADVLSSSPLNCSPQQEEVWSEKAVADLTRLFAAHAVSDKFLDLAVPIRKEWGLVLPFLAIEDSVDYLLAPESNGSSLFNYEEVPACISPSQCTDDEDFAALNEAAASTAFDARSFPVSEESGDEGEPTFLSHIHANDEAISPIIEKLCASFFPEVEPLSKDEEVFSSSADGVALDMESNESAFAAMFGSMSGICSDTENDEAVSEMPVHPLRNRLVLTPKNLGWEEEILDIPRKQPKNPVSFAFWGRL